MPDTSVTPVSVRPPFSGGESFDQIAEYAAKQLTSLAGRLPNGKPRFRAGAVTTLSRTTVVYEETGLAFKVARNSRGSSGVAPFTISCEAGTLNPQGATGQPISAVRAKLYANGDCAWSKIFTAALLNAQRRAEVAEREKITSDRKANAWEKLAAYMATKEANGDFPTPTRRGNLDPAVDGYDVNQWKWHLGEVLTVDATPFTFAINVAPPSDLARIGDDWTPENTPVGVRMGFAAYEYASQTFALHEALALCTSYAAMVENFKSLLPTPAEPDADELLTAFASANGGS